MNSVPSSFNPLDILARASARLRLTPAERSMLKLGEGFVDAGLVAAAGVLITVLTNSGNFGLKATLALTLGAFIKGVLGAVRKFASARGDLYGELAVAAANKAEQAVDQQVNSLAGGVDISAQSTMLTPAVKPPLSPGQ